MEQKDKKYIRLGALGQGIIHRILDRAQIDTNGHRRASVVLDE